MIQIQQQTSLAPTFLQSATFEHCFAIKSLKRFYILHIKCNFMLSFSLSKIFICKINAVPYAGKLIKSSSKG